MASGDNVNRNFNLPPGVTQEDVDGPPMPKCTKCGDEHNDWKGDGICDHCRAPEEIETKTE